jgi:E3 ubiquitin-protein ligase synoviolin
MRHVLFAFHERILSFTHSHNLPSLHDHQRLITGQLFLLFVGLRLMFRFLRLALGGNSFLLLLTLHFGLGVLDAASDLVSHLIFLSDRRSGGNSQSTFRFNLVTQLVFQVMQLVLRAVFTVSHLRKAIFPLWVLRSLCKSADAILVKIITFWKWHRLRSLISEALPAPDDTELGPDSLCVICRALLSKQDSRRLPCGHLYHIDCLEQWLSEHTACPFCQQDISSLLMAPGNMLQPPVVAEVPEEHEQVEIAPQDSEIAEKLRKMIQSLEEVEQKVAVVMKEVEAKRAATGGQES